MILIVVPTENGNELVNFENVTYTESTKNNVTLHFGGHDNLLKINMTKEELISEVVAASKRHELLAWHYKNILIKQLKGNNEEQY